MEKRKPILQVIPIDRNSPEKKDQSSKQKSKTKATQTFFKTLSQNNYRVQEMIDRKANILISVNAIILSILIGGGFFGNGALNLSKITSIILIASCILSILAALIAIKPFLLSIKNATWKGSNLVNPAAAIHMDLDAYKAKVNQVLKKENRIYDSLVEDIYFVSQNSKRKHIFLMLSAGIFFIGLVACFISIL